MSAGTVALLRTRLQIALWRHGWCWVTAAAATAVGAAIYFAVLQPARVALQAARTELAQAGAARRQAHAAPPVSQQQQLKVLQGALQTDATPADLVQRMAAIARSEGVALPQGDYQQQIHASTGVLQVHVHQPVRASYPQLRRYLEAVLREVPNASLDQVAARRDNVGQSQLEARLRWSLWIQAPGAPTAPAARGTP